MNLPKVIGPPALSLFFLVVLVYGMGNFMSVLPDQYRPKGLSDDAVSPEKLITVTGNEGDPPVTISLFSWGARFSQGHADIGTLRYERVYYALRDSRGALIWKLVSHDTYVAVTDPQDKEVLKIVRKKDSIEFLDRDGKLISYMILGDTSASLYTPAGVLLARSELTRSGTALFDRAGNKILSTDLPLSPAGLSSAALSPYDPVERAALMIMVK